jgi:hypothetical protein
MVGWWLCVKARDGNVMWLNPSMIHGIVDEGTSATILTGLNRYPVVESAEDLARRLQWLEDQRRKRDVGERWLDD